MSWNIQKPGDYINGDLTVVNNITSNSEIYSLGGRLALYRTAGPSYIDWSSGQNLIWRTVTSVGGAGAANQMWLNSTGLGVGGTPSARIHAIDSSGVCGAFSRAALPAAGLAALYIQAPVSSGFSNTPLLTFWYQNTGISNPNNECLAIRTNSTNRIFVNGTGAVALSGGNVAADGVGIVFPSAQSASTDANTLDDYEEGTWTPVVAASSGTPTTVTIGTCKYTKIGRQVICTFDFTVVDKGTASGSFIFSLPLTSDNLVNCGVFRENGSVGNMGQVFRNSAGDAAMFLYHNITVWVNTYRMLGTYTYCV
jgi:hypothetical protein